MIERIKKLHRFVRIGLILVLIGFGLYFKQRLEREAETGQNAVTIAGTLEGTDGTTVVVVLVRETAGRPSVASYQVRTSDGAFKFVITPGAYRLHAFEDADGDLVYDEGERVAHYGGESPRMIDAGPSDLHDGLTLALSAENDPIALDIDLSSPELQAELEFERVRAGEVVSLDDPRFTRENGTMGLWEPSRFVREVGFGVYFLEDYDPARVPVLFVHGAGGFPGEFAYLVSELDRERFQPWVYFYPTAMRLDRTGEILESMVRELEARHGFRRMCVVAHSMGGLVSRAFVNRVVEADPAQTLVPVFVTLSTPWNGHRAAEWGAEFAPVTVPSWIDMTPDSDFQEALFETSWPALPEHHLLFSFRGGKGVITGGNDDGSVALASQLDERAQERATTVFGFDVDHVKILTKPRVAAKVRAALEGALDVGSE